MGEKKCDTNEGCKNNNSKKDNKKKEEPMTVVLKLDMHCAGCVHKILKCVKSMEGVDYAKPETEASKLTVVGKIDPVKLKEKLEYKTKKKVDLISPQQQGKKGKENKGGNTKDGESNRKKCDEKAGKKTEEKKPKELPVITAVLKVALHCQGCIDKINRVVSRFKGVMEMSLDKQKDQITVRGTMDAKALAETLKQRLKRAVAIVPPKDDKKKDKKEGKDDKEKGKKENEIEKKESDNANGKEGKNCGNEKESSNGGRVDEHKMMEYTVMPGHYTPYWYGYPGYIEHLHAPQMFSDENPNACFIM